MMMTKTLAQALVEERNATFFRLRGGYPVPLAGAIWWAALSLLGYHARPHLWIFIAFATSGLVFPLAILLGRICRVNFMSDRSAISDLMFPTLIPMVLFWPVAFAAYPTAPALVPLIMAIGMSVAWPVMGWIYGRTALFTAHAIVRAIACYVLWNWFPSTRFTLLPLAVSLIYVATIIVTLIASAPSRQPASIQTAAA
jgi:hypothetical protein